jgi:hypothetical protein
MCACVCVRVCVCFKTDFRQHLLEPEMLEYQVFLSLSWHFAY